MRRPILLSQELVFLYYTIINIHFLWNCKSASSILHNYGRKVTIQFRPSCNQTKNPEVIPGIFCIGMAEVV